MADRLLRAVIRIQHTADGSHLEHSTRVLRPEQIGVYEDFARYLTDVAARGAEGTLTLPPMGRVILPPRTGKTVLAGAFIAGAGLNATVIVPTKTLVEQSRRELHAQLPHVTIGAYYGEEKDLVAHGINVATYQILQRTYGRSGCLPWQIRHSALIFADEGHRSMTTRRLEVLRDGFDSLAIRIALTATPQYDEERTLGRYFPELIHEITVAEAIELDLLAPLRIWVAEVDVDASEVRIIGGDLQEVPLGRIMSAAPFLRAVEVYRYSDENRSMAALICCASRQQAYDLLAYLREHRPADAPAPQLILGETPREQREAALSAFAHGACDTLINVGVLLEGWNSPRCKLLIDLAPSLSRVRAMQKFFRPMTKWEGQEARIYLLIPRNLPRIPILPMELFGWPSEAYDAGTLIAAPTLRASAEVSGELHPVDRPTHTPVEHVELKSRIVLNERFERPALNPRDFGQVQQVLASNPATIVGGRPCGILQFRWLAFQHPLFTGRGEQLLRYLRIPLNRKGYLTFLARVFPDQATERFLWEAGEATDDEDRSCEEDAAYLEAQLVEEGPVRWFQYGWLALAGPNGREPPPTPEDLIACKELECHLHMAVTTLKGRRWSEVIRRRFGLTGREETLEQIGETWGVTRDRVRQVEARALRELRHPKCPHVRAIREYLNLNPPKS